MGLRRMQATCGAATQPDRTRMEESELRAMAKRDNGEPAGAGRRQAASAAGRGPTPGHQTSGGRNDRGGTDPVAPALAHCHACHDVGPPNASPPHGDVKYVFWPTRVFSDRSALPRTYFSRPRSELRVKRLPFLGRIWGTTGHSSGVPIFDGFEYWPCRDEPPVAPR
jgi:hypothetical protein